MVSLLTISLSGNALAAETSSSTNLASNQLPEVISNYTESINNKDWDSFVHTFSPDIQQYYKEFPSKEQSKNKTGILSVDSISVFEAKRLPLNNILKVEPYFADISSDYTDVEYYYVGFDYEVNNESDLFYNGVKYQYIATGKLNGQEYIVGQENVYNFDELSSIGYSFNSEAEHQANNIIKKREKGSIVNFENKTILQNTEEDLTKSEDNEVIEEKSLDLDRDLSQSINIKNPQERIDLERANIGQNKSSNIQPLSATSTPSTFKLYLTGTGTLINIGFDAYAKDVLPNEWYGSWKSEALKAGAVAIKSYAWYNATYPRLPATNYGAHLTDKWENYQHYVQNSGQGQTATNAAVSAVSGIFMVNSAGNVFDTQYRAGTQGDIGTAWGGVLSQWGTQYIATNYPEYTYYTILSYYYSYSDKSSGLIKTGNY